MQSVYLGTAIMLLLFLSCSNNLIGAGRGKSDSNGELNVIVDIEDETSIMVMAESQALLVVKQIIGPNEQIAIDWTDWKQADRSISNALILSSSNIAINWPIRAEDESVRQGEYRFLIGSYDREGFPMSDADIDVEISTKNDSDHEVGKIKAWVVATDSVTPDILSVVETAVQGW